MNITRQGLLVAIAVSLGLFPAVHASARPQSLAPLSSEQIAQIVANPDRSAADRANDLRRRPEQMLPFIGIRPGIVALDLSASGGYTTELLARAIGPSGVVYGQSPPRDPNRAPTPPAAPEGNSNPTIAPSPARVDQHHLRQDLTTRLGLGDDISNRQNAVMHASELWFREARRSFGARPRPGAGAQDRQQPGTLLRLA